MSNELDPRYPGGSVGAKHSSRKWLVRWCPGHYNGSLVLGIEGKSGRREEDGFAPDVEHISGYGAIQVKLKARVFQMLLLR
jgi:hypothetical protein